MNIIPDTVGYALLWTSHETSLHTNIFPQFYTVCIKKKGNHLIFMNIDFVFKRNRF